MSLEDDRQIETLLRKTKAIAVVGASPKPWRDSGSIAQFLVGKGYKVFPINPAYQEVLGMKCYPNLKSIGSRIDMVDIFRKPEEILPIVDEAIAIGATAVWMQLGVINEEAAKRAEEAGLSVIMDRCIAIEHRRLIK